MAARARPLLAILTIALVIVVSALARATVPASAGGVGGGGVAPTAWTPPDVLANFNHWPTGGYDLTNSRNALYSTIMASNVSQLRQMWTFPLKGAGFFGDYSTTPIVVGQTVYFQDTSSNVYALDRNTGHLIWEHKFNVLNIGPNGVTYGYGRIYGATETQAFALDAATGRLLWTSRKLPRNNKEGIDDTPTVFNNTVIISTVPGSGVQSFYAGNGMGIVYALNAATGKVKWSFNTVKGGKLWGHWKINSGGGLWYPVAVDSQGRVFIGVANPAPLQGTAQYPNGSSHPGWNLYNDAVVALNGNTGKLLWYHQVTHHDIRDYDCMIGPIVADVPIGGTPTEIVMGACKSGQVVGLKASDGALIWQDAVGAHLNDTGPLPKAGAWVCPGELGGVETPMSYSNGVLYVPWLNDCQYETPTAKTTKPAKTGGVPNGGGVTAINAATGAKMWTRSFTGPTSMDFGATTVSNDLVFTSTYNGRIYALDRNNGAILWQAQAPAGINGFPAIDGNLLIVGAGAPVSKTAKTAVIAYGLP